MAVSLGSAIVSSLDHLGEEVKVRGGPEGLGTFCTSGIRGH
jgi:hypothetical protein